MFYNGQANVPGMRGRISLNKITRFLKIYAQGMGCPGIYMIVGKLDHADEGGTRQGLRLQLGKPG